MTETGDKETEDGGPLSRTRILETALRLTDGGGVESLSMRKLAREPGVQAMSLYSHVANRDDVIDGIADMVIGEIEVPSLRYECKVTMRRRANSARGALLRHSWATLDLVSRMIARQSRPSQAPSPGIFRYTSSTIEPSCFPSLKA